VFQKAGKEEIPRNALKERTDKMLERFFRKKRKERWLSKRGGRKKKKGLVDAKRRASEKKLLRWGQKIIPVGEAGE